MQAYAFRNAARVETVAASPAVTSADSASEALLRACFELFHTTCTGLAKLSVETSNDLFEMDPLATVEQFHEFKSRRGEWLKKFDVTLRELFERRMGGQRRKGRRPDPVQSLDCLRVMNDGDTSKQSALAAVAKRLAATAKSELDALDYRVAVLFGEPPGRDADNPFAPAYLLDALGLTSRTVYAEPHIAQPLMTRVVGDFVPAIAKTYIQLNRFLAERGILPGIGAVLRARSDLQPAEGRQLLPLLGRLINDIHPSLQAWRTLDLTAATEAGYRLMPHSINPYAEAATAPRSATRDDGDFPALDAMAAAGALRPVLEMLDAWQRQDPMVACLRPDAPTGIGAGVTPLNRIPWIYAAIASKIPDASARGAIDVVGFLFDYILRDPSIPPRFRCVFDRLQLPLLKVALVDPVFFADEKHPARRLIDVLAAAAIGADDDEIYGTEINRLTLSIVDAICAEFVLDVDVFEYACQTLTSATDDWQRKLMRVMQPHVDAGLDGETRDADRSRVRVLIRDKLAGADTPFEVRAFIGTVWADYLTRLRQAEGAGSESYAVAVGTMGDMLWSVAAKGRLRQKAALSKMIPNLVRNLRAGAAAVQVTEERMQRFLGVLFDLHIAAIKPDGAGNGAPRKAASDAASLVTATGRIGNVYDFVADLVLGTWLAFDKDGTRVKARLSWISPWRSTYLFTNRSGSALTVFTPEELAWEMGVGKVTLIQEPVPLFERAVSVTLEYLAEQKAQRRTA